MNRQSGQLTFHFYPPSIAQLRLSLPQSDLCLCALHGAAPGIYHKITRWLYHQNSSPVWYILHPD